MNLSMSASHGHSIPSRENHITRTHTVSLSVAWKNLHASPRS